MQVKTDKDSMVANVLIVPMEDEANETHKRLKATGFNLNSPIYAAQFIEGKDKMILFQEIRSS